MPKKWFPLLFHVGGLPKLEVLFWGPHYKDCIWGYIGVPLLWKLPRHLEVSCRHTWHQGWRIPSCISPVKPKYVFSLGSLEDSSHQMVNAQSMGTFPLKPGSSTFSVSVVTLKSERRRSSYEGSHVASTLEVPLHQGSSD